MYLSLFLQSFLLLLLSLLSFFLLFIRAAVHLCRTLCFCCRPKASAPPRSILITGASSGLGSDLAQLYARRLTSDATLFLTGRNVAALESVAVACRAHGATVRTRAVDVTDAGALSAWVADAEREAPLDLVVANAGVTERTAGVWGDLERGARVCMDVNVGGVFSTVFPALAGMRARGRGQVCVIASISGFTQFSPFDGYSASKAAVRMWGEGLRYRVAHEGIRVSVVCPGYVATPMTDAFQGSLNLVGMVSSAFAAQRIVDGLAQDEPLIIFPTSTYLLAWAVGCLPLPLKDLMARSGLFAEVRYDRAAAAAAAGRAQPLTRDA
jgi:short-subunit dehydrogenase